MAIDDILYVSFLNVLLWKSFWFSYCRIGDTGGGDRFLLWVSIPKGTVHGEVDCPQGRAGIGKWSQVTGLEIVRNIAGAQVSQDRLA